MSRGRVATSRFPPTLNVRARFLTICQTCGRWTTSAYKGVCAPCRHEEDRRRRGLPPL